MTTVCVSPFSPMTTLVEAVSMTYPRRALDLRDDICPRSQVGDMDLTRRIGGENSILCERGVSNDAIQADFAAGGSGHAELRAGEGCPVALSRFWMINEPPWAGF